MSDNKKQVTVRTLKGISIRNKDGDIRTAEPRGKGELLMELDPGTILGVETKPGFVFVEALGLEVKTHKNHLSDVAAGKYLNGNKQDTATQIAAATARLEGLLKTQAEEQAKLAALATEEQAQQAEIAEELGYGSEDGEDDIAVEG